MITHQNLWACKMSKVDLHRCGDCLKEFNSFEAFLIHKLLYEKYKLQIVPSKRISGLRIPTFIRTQVIDDSLEQLPVLNDSVVASDIVSGIEKVTDAASSSRVVRCATLKTSIFGQSSICDEEKNKTTVVPVKIDVTAEKLIEKGDVLETTLSAKVDCNLSVEQDVDEESDDNMSVWSQTESLRIDESANIKDNLSSPHPEGQLDNELKQTSELYCKYCDRYYKNKVVLRVHKETVHSGDRPFACKTCDEAFKTKGSLVRHERTHTGERPFCCRECGRSFCDSGSLWRHVKRVHRKLLGQMPLKEVKIFVTQLIPEAGSKTETTNSANS